MCDMECSRTSIKHPRSSQGCSRRTHSAIPVHLTSAFFLSTDHLHETVSLPPPRSFFFLNCGEQARSGQCQCQCQWRRKMRTKTVKMGEDRDNPLLNIPKRKKPPPNTEHWLLTLTLTTDMGIGLDRVAFGAPGIEPRWTSSSKDGLGTARSESCRLWFTLSHGIINEIYYPTADQPNTRDFERQRYFYGVSRCFCCPERGHFFAA